MKKLTLLFWSAALLACAETNTNDIPAPVVQWFNDGVYYQTNNVMDDEKNRGLGQSNYFYTKDVVRTNKAEPFYFRAGDRTVELGAREDGVVVWKYWPRVQMNTETVMTNYLGKGFSDGSSGLSNLPPLKVGTNADIYAPGYFESVLKARDKRNGEAGIIIGAGIAFHLLTAIPECYAKVETLQEDVKRCFEEMWLNTAMTNCTRVFNQVVRDRLDKQFRSYVVNGTWLTNVPNVSWQATNVDLLTITNIINGRLAEVTITNVINKAVADGTFCKLRGHAWKPHLHVTLEYAPDRIACRECAICGAHQEQYATEWK